MIVSLTGIQYAQTTEKGPPVEKKKLYEQLKAYFLR